MFSLQLAFKLKDLLSAEGEEKIAVKERLEEGIAILEETFVKCSKGKAYFGGDDIGYIDIAPGSCLQWIKTVEEITEVKLVDEAKTPKLFGWADRFMSHGAVQMYFQRLEGFQKLSRRFKQGPELLQTENLL